MYSETWIKDGWLSIYSGVNLIAVFCPKHEKECDVFFDNYSARGLKKK